jgi:hypothetical protein
MLRRTSSAVAVRALVARPAARQRPDGDEVDAKSRAEPAAAALAHEARAWFEDLGVLGAAAATSRTIGPTEPPPRPTMAQ